MLEIDDVSRTFGTTTAVDHLSLRVAPGDFLGLIGPNGAGKSTTIKMIVGQLKPSRGTIRINGLDVFAHPIAARRAFGYVPEFVSLYEFLTGAEFLEFIAEVKGLSPDAASTELREVLELLELGEERTRLIRTYSQGMRRKVAIAAALLGSPPLLVLDEALNGLDPDTSARLKDHLRHRVSQGDAVILSSHILEQLERICNRAAIMKKGRCIDLLDRAQLDAIRNQPGGLEAYFMKALRA